jgi:hypothetical protein
MIRVRFDEGLFELSDEPDEGPHIPPADQAVLDAVRARPEGVAASTLAASIGKGSDATRMALNRLGKLGLVEKRGEKWRANEANETELPALSFARQNGDRTERTEPAPLGAVRSFGSPMPERGTR